MKFLETIRDKETIIKFVKYCIAGGSAFVLEYLLFFLLKEVFSVNYILANALVYTTMFWFSFLLNKYFTFGAKGKIGAQLYRYVLLYAFNLVVTNLALFALTDLLHINPLIGKFFVSGMVVLWNFPIYKKFIYR